MDGSRGTTGPCIRGLRLALGHQSRVGKDTFAEYVVRAHGGLPLAFAAGVYDIAASIQRALGVQQEKDRDLLQMIGMGLRRRYGDDVWVDQVRNRIAAAVCREPQMNIIVTDLRFPNEMLMLKKTGFITVKISRAAAPVTDHISETALAGAEFDYHLENNGTLGEFTAGIEDLLRAICTD
jgi:hypothetical protein